MGQFVSLQDFIWMGGHGVYVWAVYAITLGIVGIHTFGLRQQRQKTLKAIARVQVRENT